MKKPYFYVFSLRENFGEVTPTLPNSSSSLWKCSCYMDNLENIGKQTNPKASFVTALPSCGYYEHSHLSASRIFFCFHIYFLNKNGVTVVFISLLFHSLMVNSFLHVILYIFMMISLRNFFFFLTWPCLVNHWYLLQSSPQNDSMDLSFRLECMGIFIP